jgi:hypothetical protein
MALFTDSMISSMSDLQAYDSAILEVARIEGVDLQAKLKLAEQEIGLELQAFLLRHNNNSNSPGTGYGLEDIVVTNGLNQWHSLKTLSMVYGDVYNSQLNDRYLGKWKQFVNLARTTADLYLQTGVGVVYHPVARAQKPSLSVTSGGPDAGTFMVGIAWRNFLGQVGAPSEPVVHETQNGEALVVTPPPAPPGSITYDVFAGYSESDMSQQNSSPLPAGESWIMPVTGLDPGDDLPGPGQPPDRYLRLQRTLQRG